MQKSPLFYEETQEKYAVLYSQLPSKEVGATKPLLETVSQPIYIWGLLYFLY